MALVASWPAMLAIGEAAPRHAGRRPDLAAELRQRLSPTTMRFVIHTPPTPTAKAQRRKIVFVVTAVPITARVPIIVPAMRSPAYHSFNGVRTG